MKRFVANPVRAIGGTLVIPGDKSVSHRALMFGGLADGLTQVSGFLPSEDCRATMGALRAMGVRVEEHSDTELTVHGVGVDGLRAADGPLDMGNAGTAMRLFMGLLSWQRFDSTLVGDSSLTRRPMERAAKPLREMGARIESTEGHAPIRIGGGATLAAIDYAMPMASAQVKSAVLLAGLAARGTTRVTEPAPTRDHTERMLGAFGVRVAREGATASIEGGQRLKGTTVAVPGDFSSAAFFLVAGTLAAKPGGLLLRGVGMNPTRTGLLDILRAMGAHIIAENERVSGGEPVADLRVHASALHGIEVPERLVPLAIDEFPALFIAAAVARGDTIVHGAEELRVKETDRLAVMAEGLAVLGVEHELYPDGLRLRGGSLRGGTVDSRGDHRIAMSFAIASLAAQAPITILDVDNVATSFPNFVALARSAGLDLSTR